MACPDHDRPELGVCPTCGREICELCLEHTDAPEAFECPDCGGFGVAFYDEDPGDLTEAERPEP